MSNDFSPINTPETETPMFAGVPSWERGKKRRNFGSRGSRAASEPRSFASDEAPIPTRPVTLSEDARAYEARMDAVDPTDTSFATAPVYATRTARRNNGSAPIAILAGVILLGGLAAAGWYAYQPHNAGVAELTPGSDATTTTTTQVAQAAPMPGEPQTASAPAAAPAPAATTHSTTTTTTTKAPKAAVSHTTVTRVAPARSAAQSGANASTTAAAPMPAPAPAAPAAAAAPAPLVLTIPPAQAAPTTTAPAPAEAPLPTQTAPTPAPTQTPPS